MPSSKKYGKDTDLALSMWVKLARAYETFNKRSFENIRTFGLTEPQFAVMECLGHLGPLTTGELCRKMLVSGGNMTVVIDNLEKEDLAERIRSKEDRRTIRVQLSRKGKKLFDAIFVQHATHIRNLAGVLTKAEQKELSGLLKKLGLALQK
jgi:MarR family 2-MHQ and catechol resistance regulon transcriptional repressor